MNETKRRNLSPSIAERANLTPEQVQRAIFIKRDGVVLKSRYERDLMPEASNATLYPGDPRRIAW